MSRRAVRTEEAPAPVAGAPYSQAIAASGGELVWVSGQVPLTPAGDLAAADVAGQTRQCLGNTRFDRRRRRRPAAAGTPRPRG